MQAATRGELAHFAIREPSDLEDLIRVEPLDGTSYLATEYPMGLVSAPPVAKLEEARDTHTQLLCELASEPDLGRLARL